MANIFPQELQGPGYSSASASGKLRHRVPVPHRHSTVGPPPLSLASCAPDVSTSLSAGGCTGNGDLPEGKNNMECLNGRASLGQSRSESLTPRIKPFSVASCVLQPFRLCFFLFAKYMQKPTRD